MSVDPSPALRARLTSILASVTRSQLSYRKLRARLGTSERLDDRTITAALRELEPPWFPSLMKRQNGAPRYYYRDTPATEPLRARIEQRALALQSEHVRAPKDAAAARAELETLGPYIPGEPRARSLRRAQLKRLTAPTPQRGRFSIGGPLPTDPAALEAELRALPLWAWGESMKTSRRRAALQRALGIYAGKHRRVSSTVQPSASRKP